MQAGERATGVTGRSEQTLHQRRFCLPPGRRFGRIDTVRCRCRDRWRCRAVGLAPRIATYRRERKLAEYSPSFGKGEINKDHDELQNVLR